MKYKLINPIKYNTATEQVLYNRGIKEENFTHYLNTTDDDINSPLLLGESTLRESVSALMKTIFSEGDAIAVVDADCDGFTSSALLINYLHDFFPAWVENHLTWILHQGKQHGLNDCWREIAQKRPQLVFCADSSSNDYAAHKELHDLGITIIVLDHHEAPKWSDDAIVLNNQLSAYPNKFLSGVGIVWQWTRYIDSLIDSSRAEYYLDLVALGDMADMESMLALETKHLINKGFREENVHNPFISYMADKNSYSLGGKLTPMGVAFYIAPYVNAIVRSGTMQEKELIFESMLEFKAFEKVNSTKRGHKLGEQELLVIQAVRTALNVKNRQTKSQEKGMEFLENQIAEKSLLEHKVLLFLIEPGQVDSNIAGLVANKLMAKYQRPCCVLTRCETYDTEICYDENDVDYLSPIGKRKIVYQGSARGCDKVGINNFKDICERTGAASMCAGHQGAFGLAIPAENLNKFISATDEILKDMSDEPIYAVDYIFHSNDVNPQNVLDIAGMDDLYGKDFDEPFIAVEHIKVTKDNLTLMSPDKKPTLKITLPNVSLIKFNSSQEEYENLYSENGYIEINVVARANANSWNGRVSPQLLIEEYEIIDSSKYYF